MRTGRERVAIITGSIPPPKAAPPLPSAIDNNPVSSIYRQLEISFGCPDDLELSAIKMWTPLRVPANAEEQAARGPIYFPSLTLPSPRPSAVQLYIHDNQSVDRHE